jgi:predicted HTH domain antitoxin
MQIAVELPDDISQHTNPGRDALERLAIEGYRSGALSHPQAGQLLGLSRFEFDDFPIERKIFRARLLDRGFTARPRGSRKTSGARTAGQRNSAAALALLSGGFRTRNFEACPRFSAAFTFLEPKCRHKWRHGRPDACSTVDSRLPIASVTVCLWIASRSFCSPLGCHSRPGRSRSKGSPPASR